MTPSQPIPESQLLPRLDALEDRLTNLSSETKRLQRLALLGTLAAGIAHDINNVLTPAMGYAQLAQGRPDDRELSAKALEKSINAIGTTSQIVRSMLGLSAGDSQDCHANVRTVIDDTLSCVGRAPARGVEIRTEVNGDLFASIRPVALQQVLMNLALNAVQAIKGEGVVTIAAIDAGDKTMVEVRDTGPGIPENVVADIFKPFVSSRPESTTKQGGNGLGLAICRELIEEAGGTIRVDSGSAGATFTLTLPSAPAEKRQAS